MSAARRFLVEWHQLSSHVEEVVAHDAREARGIFRERTRRLGYGVTIQRITVHPEDRKPNTTEKAS